MLMNCILLISQSSKDCVVPENIQGVGGFQKPNFLNESITLKGNFQRDGGFNLKNLPWEGYGYFLEQHI